MKKKLLYLFAFTALTMHAQQSLPFSEDFESETPGTNITAITPPFSEEFSDGGSGTSVVATGDNGTNVISCSGKAYTGTEKNHYLRSPAFACTPGVSYTIQFDGFASNGKINIRVRESTDGGVFNTMGVGPVEVTTSVGTVKESNDQVNFGNNTHGTVTAVFTAAEGITQFKLQIYQFGPNSYEIDNLMVSATDDLGVDTTDASAVDLQSNLVSNSLSLSTNLVISNVTAVNMMGAQTSLSSADGTTFDTSNLKTGIYLLKVTLADGSAKTFQIVKQ